MNLKFNWTHFWYSIIIVFVITLLLVGSLGWTNYFKLCALEIAYLSLLILIQENLL